MQDFETFKSESLGAGYDEVLVREWAADSQAALHDHPFEASAIVAQGEMWLTRGEATQHLMTGDRFRLMPGELHSERYGPSGTIYWVARRS